MTALAFSYEHPKFVSVQFTGNNTISCSYVQEGYYLVSIEELGDNGQWTRKGSFFTYKDVVYDFSKATEGKYYRLTAFKKPASVTIEAIADAHAPVDDQGVRDIVNNMVADVAKSGKAEDVNLTAIAGLVATQVQTAIAELLGKIVALGAAISYEGQVEEYAALPSQNLKKGHMYNVVAANGNIPAGTNYVWNGNEWDPMTGQIDLTPFLRSTDAATTYVPLNATTTAVGADVVRLLAINGQGKAISITPKIIGDYIIKSLLDYHILAVD